jgi:two-component system chemotaxis response regulator CheB
MSAETSSLAVIGGSAGSLSALRELLPEIAPATTASFVVVVHQHRHSTTGLLPVLSAWSPIPARSVEDKAAIEPGVLFVAPANYHTLIETRLCFALSTDERVSFARPAIDLVFESAARAFGGRAVAVLLSGGGSDGVAGLARVRKAGGVTICQDPASSEEPRLPRAAIDAGVALEILAPRRIGARLAEICG